MLWEVPTLLYWLGERQPEFIEKATEIVNFAQALAVALANLPENDEGETNEDESADAEAEVITPVLPTGE